MNSGIGGGTLAAVKPGSGPVVSAVALLALAVPVFVLGPLLIHFMAVGLRLFPTALWGSPSHLVLPALTLGIPVGGALARFWRVTLLDTMCLPECLAARARGLGEWQLVWRHAGPRSLPLMLNYVGPLLAGLVTGSVVVEKIFSIPGMGRFYVDSALARDYPVVIGATLIYAIVLLFVHTVVDISHMHIDPRLRKEHNEWTVADRELRTRHREAVRAARQLRKEQKEAERKAKEEIKKEEKKRQKALKKQMKLEKKRRR